MKESSAAGRWAIVALYAAAMAWVEAAVVFYLRTMTQRIDPYQPRPLPLIGGLAEAELVRELATLIMLLSVGILAGRTWRGRLGCTAIAFGLWDILYYVFLKVICGWPHSLFDWDVLFLIPLPWWGPVLAPVCIASLMIMWGMLASRFDSGPLGRASWGAWLASGAGIALALYVFMADSLRVVSKGAEALREALPVRFNWPLFGVALCLMMMPVAEIGRRILFREAVPEIGAGVDAEERAVAEERQ